MKQAGGAFFFAVRLLTRYVFTRLDDGRAFIKVAEFVVFLSLRAMAPGPKIRSWLIQRIHLIRSFSVSR